jgi:hypothetical protein
MDPYPDPDYDPDADPGGQKITHKTENVKKFHVMNYEVLDVLFSGLKASSVA